jgi:hypothetical protein
MSAFSKIFSPRGPSREQNPQKKYELSQFRIEIDVLQKKPVLEHSARIIFLTEPDRLKMIESDISEQTRSLLSKNNVVQLEIQLPTNDKYLNFARVLSDRDDAGYRHINKYNEWNVKKLSIVFKSIAPFGMLDQSDWGWDNIRALNYLISSSLWFFRRVTDFAVIGFRDIQFPDVHSPYLKNLYLEGATVDSDYIVADYMVRENRKYDLPNLELVTIKNILPEKLYFLNYLINALSQPLTKIRFENLRGEFSEIYNFQSFPKNMKDAIIADMDTAERREVHRVVGPDNFLAAINAKNPKSRCVRKVQNKFLHIDPDTFYGELERYANESEEYRQQRNQGNTNAEKPRPMGTPDTPSPPKLAATELPPPPQEMTSSARRTESPPELTQQVSAKFTLKPTPKRQSAKWFPGGRRKKTRRHRKDRRSAKAYTRGRRRLPSR